MGDMWQLYQFPLCPFSRKVRLLLGEKGVGYELVRESPWQRRDEFLDMNPAGQTPVMVDEERGVLLVDSMAICEFFEETVEKSAMINGTAVGRAEIRRLVTWFDTHFYQDVTGPLLHERMVKRVARTGIQKPLTRTPTTPRKPCSVRAPPAAARACAAALEQHRALTAEVTESSPSFASFACLRSIRSRVYSTRMLAARMTFAHLACSLFMKAANCCGVLPRGA